MHDRNTLPRRQRGLTFLSWLVVIVIAIFFALIAVKMVPTYLENFAIRKVLTNMEMDRSVRDMGPRQIKNSLVKRFQINGVYDFDKDNIKIKKVKNGIRITIDYEVRKPVIGNVDILMTFSESADIPQ